MGSHLQSCVILQPTELGLPWGTALNKMKKSLSFLGFNLNNYSFFNVQSFPEMLYSHLHHVGSFIYMRVSERHSIGIA